MQIPWSHVCWALLVKIRRTGLKRRLFCDAPNCSRRTFAEQVEGLTIRYGRYAAVLLEMLRAVGLALASSAGARLLAVLNVVVSRVTLLSIVLALPEPVVECPRIPEVDECALKRSRRYGTMLVDVETHRGIDILAHYTGDTFAAWLTVHPGAEVICQDRANSFSDGARRGAPQAQQCGDRFHLWQNLGTAVERTASRLRSTWLPPDRDPSATSEVLPDKDEGPLTQRNRERHAAVHALMVRGMGLTGTTRELRLDSKTVRRFMRAASVEEIPTPGPSGRTGTLDGHADYLAQRRDEGCTGAHILRAELAAERSRVNKPTVRRFVHRMREHGAPTPRSLAPRAREVSALILHPPRRPGRAGLSRSAARSHG